MNIEITSCKEVADLILPFSLQLPNSEILKIFKSENEKQIIQAKEFHIVSLHHVAKIENKNYKIPAIPGITPKIRKILKTEGMFLYRIFELCVGLHPRAINPYKNAYYWFFDINHEILNGKILQILNPFEFPKKPKNGDKKRELTSIYCNHLSQMKNFENPFKDDKNTPTFSNLIDLAIYKSQQNNEFKKTYYDPFLVANRDCINSYLTPDWCVVSTQNGQTSRQGIGGYKKFF